LNWAIVQMASWNWEIQFFGEIFQLIFLVWFKNFAWWHFLICLLFCFFRVFLFTREHSRYSLCHFYCCRNKPQKYSVNGRVLEWYPYCYSWSSKFRIRN
jgi:hypothetical protein